MPTDVTQRLLGGTVTLFRRALALSLHCGGSRPFPATALERALALEATHPLARIDSSPATDPRAVGG